MQSCAQVAVIAYNNVIWVLLFVNGVLSQVHVLHTGSRTKEWKEDIFEHHRTVRKSKHVTPCPIFF